MIEPSQLRTERTAWQLTFHGVLSGMRMKRESNGGRLLAIVRSAY